MELEQAGIPCGPVNNIEQAAADPQINARDMIIEVEHEEAGKFRVVNSPFKFSRTPYEVKKASPELGRHTREVLGELLGMTDAEIDKLEDAGVV